nr:reverse transcriptase domain-containing protein [Tanacetum cinerariifolium]
VTPPRHSVQPVEAPIPAATPKPTSPKTSSSGKRKNRKTCFVCSSVDHLIKDCNFYAKPKSQPTPRNNPHRGYNKQHASFSKKFPQKHIVPAAVLPKSKPVSVAAVCADRRNYRHSKQPFILKESPVDTMADQRTMTKFLRAPIEGYTESIMVPSILAKQFELKHSLINMMTSDQFFGLKKDNPHDHIRWFNKITSTIKYKDVPNSAIKLMLFPFSLAGAARRWLEKEPPRSILTWEDLVSKFINEFFPPQERKNLRNEISNFQQRFDESFHKAWDRYKDLLRTFPYHGFTELHQLDTFYNALNPADQDSLNSFAIGNVLERRTQYVLMIIENKSKKKLGLPDIIFTRMTLELANRAICTPVGIARDVFVPVGKFTFSAYFVIVDYESDPRVPLILGRPVLQTARALIDVHGEEMILLVILKKLPEKLRDFGKFLIPCGFSELKCKALADIANRAICTPAGIARDVFVPVGKFTFPADFVIVDYESDPRVPLILGRPVLQTARALIDVHGEEMILHLFATNHQSGNPTFSSHPNLTSPEVKDDIFDPGGDIVLIEKLINLDSTKDLPPLYNINPLSGSTTSSSPNHLLEEFVDELALITFPPRNDDLPFDIESDLKEIEYLLNYDPTKEMDSILEDSVNEDNLANLNDNLVDTMPEMFTDKHALDYSSPPFRRQSINLPPRNDDLSFDIESDLKKIEYLLNYDPTKEMDSILEDSVNEDNLANLNDNLVDTMPEMFTDKHALDYSSPPLYDDHNDDLDEFESDNEYVYDDPFDSKGEKIKESKLLIDGLDLPISSDFLPSPEYDSFLFENFSEVDALPSTNNEDKVFNPRILIHENLFGVITRVAPDKDEKKMAISYASLILEDFDPPLSLYELPFHKEAPRSETLLSFSSENEEKVVKPGILTSIGVHISLLLELSHRGPKGFKIIKTLEILMEIFPCSHGEDIRI